MNEPLRVLSWNMQAGMGTRRARDYALRFHENLVPAGKSRRLEAAAQALRSFDLVGVQECDSGSWRTGMTNQARVLAKEGGFDHHAFHSSRRVARVAESGLALLSRYPIHDPQGHVLPSRIPGRAALSACVETPAGPLRVLVVHFSLGPRDQAMQWGWVHAWIAADQRPCLVMGDFNVGPGCAVFQSVMERIGERFDAPHSFPSWKPSRALDHILVVGLAASPPRCVDPGVSDHLALAREIWLPDQP